MTYTIETRRTVNGPRYYIRLDGKLMRGGFANRTAAVEHGKWLEVIAKARGQLKAEIHNWRGERTQ